MVSMMVGDEPADALYLLVGIASETCEQLTGDSRPFPFLKFAVLITILLLARPDANVMHESRTFEDELRFLVQAFAFAYQRGVSMHFRGMLNALRVAIVIVNHGECQSV